MTTERKTILEMLANNKITVDEAERLLSLIDEKPLPEERKTIKEQFYPRSKKSLFIQVVKNDQRVVNLAFPLMTLKVLSKTGNLRLFMNNKVKFDNIPSDIAEQLNIDEIIEMIESNQSGEILNVKTDDGEEVRIFIK